MRTSALTLQPRLELVQAVEHQRQGLVVRRRVVPVQIPGRFQRQACHQRRSRCRRQLRQPPPAPAPAGGQSRHVPYARRGPEGYRCLLPWAERVGAWPFLTVLAPSERSHQERGTPHKQLTDWARQMITQAQ